MTKEKIAQILRNHKDYLNGVGGSFADLRGAELGGADLIGAELRGGDLRGANLRGANLIGADLSRADLRYANLRDANLRHANLRDADLTGANLSYADLKCANLSDANLSGAALDYSCLPLCCGSLQANFDDKQIIQLIYHAVKAGLQSKYVSDDIKAEISKLICLANRFHRVGECGLIEQPTQLK